MGARSCIAALLLLLGGCAAAADDPGKAEPQAAAVPNSAPAPPQAVFDAELLGRWRIVSLNGAAPAPGHGTGDARGAPYLVFGPGSYGGNTGCNSFGGYSVLLADRLYASGAGQTAIGCGPLTAQEDAIIGLLTASPTVALAPGGRLIFSSGGRAMLLERDPSGDPAQQPQPGPALLAGTSWTIGSVDGKWLQNRSGLGLAYEADRWTLTGPCGTRSGGWRQSGDRLDPVGAQTATPKPCSAEAAAIETRLAALLASSTRFATGPNGEILIGGGGHWFSGERPRADLVDEAPLLAGAWRIVEIDGAAPAPGNGAPGIAFGPSGYSGGTGCNSFQGYYLAHARRVFTGTTMQTEMGCGAPLAAQERRIIGLVDSAPAVARTESGEIALVDAKGRLLLRREGPTAALPQGRLWSGEPLQAELTMLNGTPLRLRHAEPETRLRLTARRFDIDTGCGHLGGIWRRRGPGIEFLTDAEEPPKGACGGALVSRLAEFMRFMNGQARILVGASGELVIAGEQHWLAGRILGPPMKRR